MSKACTQTIYGQAQHLLAKLWGLQQSTSAAERVAYKTPYEKRNPIRHGLSVPTSFGAYRHCERESQSAQTKTTFDVPWHQRQPTQLFPHDAMLPIDVLKLQYLGNSFIRKGEVHAKLKSIKQLAHLLLASIEIPAWPLQSGPACKQLEEVASTATMKEPTNHTNWALKRYSWHSISQVVCLRISEDTAVRHHLSKILVLRCFECFTLAYELGTFAVQCSTMFNLKRPTDALRILIEALWSIQNAWLDLPKA